MGDNLNQLAARAHWSHSLSQQDFERLVEMRKEFWNAVERVEQHKSITEGIDGATC